MRFILWLPLACLACAAPTPLLEGAWKSDRERTLAALAQVELAPEAREILESEELFGHMVHVYRGGRAYHVFDGLCSHAATFRVVSSDADSATVRYFDVLLQERVTSQFDVEGDTLWVPILALPQGSREAFRRTTLAAVLEQHPCLHELLDP